MYRPGSTDERRTRRTVVVRSIGFVIALALGAIALFMIVQSDSTKTIKIGVVIGFWGAVIAAIAAFGTRAPQREVVPIAVPVPAPEPSPSRELDLRKVGEIEAAAVARARREFQEEVRAQLEAMLRAQQAQFESRLAAQLTDARDRMRASVREEVEAGVSRQVSDLRAEVAALRSELVEKVGGQLRLERIETTRLIGSDLEALQQELRRLRELGGSGDTFHMPPPEVPEPGEIRLERVRPVSAAVVEVDAPAQAVATPEHGRHGAGADDAVVPDADSQPQPEPEPAAARHAPEVAAVPQVSEPPAPAPSRSADPFASLPRITPFEYELDPLEPAAPAADQNGSAGRRHAAEDDGSAAGAHGGGRRRRRDDDGDNDVLARILARHHGD